MKNKTKIILLMVFAAMVLVFLFPSKNKSKVAPQWSSLVMHAEHQKAADEYTREYGWKNVKNPISAVKDMGINKKLNSENEFELLKQIREELKDDIKLAASLIRNLSNKSIYEKFFVNASDVSALEIINEIEIQAEKMLKRHTEALVMLRKYAKSASGPIVNEYVSIIDMLEKTCSIFNRIKVYTAMAKDKSSEPEYESIMSSRYAVISSEYKRLESEYLNNR